MPDQNGDIFPADPLERLSDTVEYRRRMISGILESYNSNYDVFAEAVQNATDAVEDAKLCDLSSPYRIEVIVNLQENWFGILDTGIGMGVEQVSKAFAPSISFKTSKRINQLRDDRNATYRGYKGVGLTYLAYGTDDVRLHSKRNGTFVKGRMRYARSWLEGDIEKTPCVKEDTSTSPLDDYDRGTYLQVQLSNNTRPRSLGHLASNMKTWSTILRTRTAIGQILLFSDPIVELQPRLTFIDSDGTQTTQTLTPEFFYPHLVDREPSFRFLNITEHYEEHAEEATPPEESIRQDGIYIKWRADRIRDELTGPQLDELSGCLNEQKPSCYAFMPYQASIWTDINELATGMQQRKHLTPGLMIGIARQRLADVFDIRASRYETLSRNVMVLVHFKHARPDQGRKTVQENIMELAQATADRAVQYIAQQREFLKPMGESPTPEEREIERGHDDWRFNVRTHADNNPLRIDGITLASEPLVEQDVVGLFHQLTGTQVLPGLDVYATSNSHTYDCLCKFECQNVQEGLQYVQDRHQLGLSEFILGNQNFSTRLLTVEFKNNLDKLIDDLESPDSPKNYNHIDINVCWSKNAESFPGYEIKPISEQNLDERKYPGMTHLLHRGSESHSIELMFLKDVIQKIEAGQVQLRENTSRE